MGDEVSSLLHRGSSDTPPAQELVPGSLPRQQDGSHRVQLQTSPNTAAPSSSKEHGPLSSDIFILWSRNWGLRAATQ